MLSKKTKYGIKALTFWHIENQTPVAIADIAKSENISVKF
jgi:DNA-binding IscR family transcriptional regulator